MTGLPHAVTHPGIRTTRLRIPPERSVLAAAWLFTVAVCVIAMVVVGGATRLTGSGLSITQWKPFAGAIPPLDPAAWNDLFSRYKAIPQYRLINAGMTLGAFKSIFWWEWAHRLLGRVLGVVFAVPFLALVATRRLPRRLVWPCAGLFVLGGLQGLVGWWMVASGLETRVYVAPERLTAHLGLALALFCALIWTALEARWGGRVPRARPERRAAAFAFLGLVYLQCLLGALVAGNHAGLANADWPLMSGRVIPGDYWQGGVWDDSRPRSRGGAASSPIAGLWAGDLRARTGDFGRAFAVEAGQGAERGHRRDRGGTDWVRGRASAWRRAARPRAGASDHRQPAAGLRHSACLAFTKAVSGIIVPFSQVIVLMSVSWDF